MFQRHIVYGYGYYGINGLRQTRLITPLKAALFTVFKLHIHYITTEFFGRLWII